MFIGSHFNKDNDIIILDSDQLQEGWREEIRISNRASKYKWENFTTNLRMYEDCEDDEQLLTNDSAIAVETETLISNDEGNITQKDIPKRLFIFTTEKLLTQLTKKIKTSLDETFKYCCHLWSQHFIWMVKVHVY